MAGPHWPDGEQVTPAAVVTPARHFAYFQPVREQAAITAAVHTFAKAAGAGAADDKGPHVATINFHSTGSVDNATSSTGGSNLAGSLLAAAAATAVPESTYSDAVLLPL